MTPQRGNDVADEEVREFLEGLLEGFRAAAAANAAQGNTGPRQPKWFEVEGNRGGTWSDLNELEKTLPKLAAAEVDGLYAKSPNISPTRSRAGQSPAVGASPRRLDTSAEMGASRGSGFASDPMSTMMRRHALRSFLEEMCGSVAKAFEQMATLAVKHSLGSQGGIGLPDQRMKYKFSPPEFQKTLSNMGYGVGAGPDWWRALFKSLDVDEDGAVSLQDMYDALVLDLPPVAPGGSSGFFGGQSPGGGRSPSPISPQQRTLSPQRRSPGFNSTIETNASGRGFANDNECRVCGSEIVGTTIFCNTCGTRRPG